MKRSRWWNRRGAILPMIAVLAIVLIGMIAFSVDVAYIQLTRCELRAATDAAAKAGAEALTRLQSEAEARKAAKEVAALNTVAGKPLLLTDADLTFGQAQSQADGSWAFTAGATPYRALKVNSLLSANNTNGAVGLFFGKVFGVNDFSPAADAVASQFEQELVLCLDRSHSMCFDHSGTDWKYPPPIYSDQTKGLKNKPQVASRWASLTTAVNSFVDIAQGVSTPPRMALVTWGSTITLSSYEGNLTGKTFNAVDTDLALASNNFANVKTKIAERGSNVMLGGTNMSGGIDRAVQILTSNSVRPLSKKIIVLMTDGQWNQGRDPVLAAQDAAAAGIVIHTVSFLSTDPGTMQTIANTTGGKHYQASDAATLNAAFQELARTLPVVLTQ